MKAKLNESKLNENKGMHDLILTLATEYFTMKFTQDEKMSINY